MRKTQGSTRQRIIAAALCALGSLVVRRIRSVR